MTTTWHQQRYLTRYFQARGAEDAAILKIARLCELIAQDLGTIPPYGGPHVKKQYMTDFYWRLVGKPRGGIPDKPPQKPICGLPAAIVKSKAFYDTAEWKAVRYEALKKHGAACQCCGATRAQRVFIQVDHIKPRSTHPELALDINNLQILCEPCNSGKSNRDRTDWRHEK